VLVSLAQAALCNVAMAASLDPFAPAAPSGSGADLGDSAPIADAPQRPVEAPIPPPMKASPAPPLLPFGLSVGITGHRSASAGHAALASATPRLAALLDAIERAAEQVRARDAALFADEPTHYRLVSPLADGADQIAARLALARDWALEAILPFPRDHYCEDFDSAEDCDRFKQLFARARSQLELPGDREHSLDAYVSAGRAVVAHADIIIALWNGEPARGRGGTAEIVEHALRAGLPVIHLPTHTEQPLRILWTGFNDPALDILDFCDSPERPFDARTLEQVLAALLSPPSTPGERECVAIFHNERERRVRRKLSYPLLLAAMGVKPLRRSALVTAPYADATRADWESFHVCCGAAGHAVAGGHAALEDAYSWADKLAEHYATAHRSGHVLNFVLAALAVSLALATLLLPAGLKPLMVVSELLVIGAIVVNTEVGKATGWHRRWLDYRSIAEQLRPMRSMKLSLLARPPAMTRRGNGRWVDWYASGWWRQMGAPSGRVDQDAIDEMAALVVREELKPQIAYHHMNAHRMHKLSHRLHTIATSLFALTITALVAYLVFYAFSPGMASGGSKLLVVLTAGLPALGAALQGIREQGEFERAATRSHSTAAQLEKLAGDLSVRPLSLTRAKALVEEAARVMLDDVGEWRSTFETRKMALPA
jgi:hypothetical protein